MPMRAFWHFSGYIERVLAHEARTTFEMLVSAQSTEGGEAMREYFASQVKEPVTLSGRGHVQLNSERDQAGFDELRSMV